MHFPSGDRTYRDLETSRIKYVSPFTKSQSGGSSRCSLLNFMVTKNPRVTVQREVSVPMVLPCAMVPQIILYGIEGENG